MGSSTHAGRSEVSGVWQYQQASQICGVKVVLDIAVTDDQRAVDCPQWAYDQRLARALVVDPDIGVELQAYINWDNRGFFDFNPCWPKTSAVPGKRSARRFGWRQANACSC